MLDLLLSLGMLSSFERPGLLVVAVIVAAPILIIFAQVLFGRWDDILESMRLWYQPDWLSLLRGEWIDDRWVSLKLFVFVIGSISVITGFYKLAKELF